MHMTLKAILARCNGNYTEAVSYCEGIAHQYPHLKAEYENIIIELAARGRVAAGGVQ